MIKSFKLIICLMFICLFLCGCSNKDETGILFNREPISQMTVKNCSRDFEVDKPIYYLFYSPDKISTEFIRVQVIKVGDKIPRGGYKIIWTNEYRVMKQNVFYYHNYFVLHSAGTYMMQIFSMDDLINPLAKNFFYVH